MKQAVLLLLACVTLGRSDGFGGSEEKFIKKYAMMKVYEGCFGLQVLKEVRREMKEAALKCSGFSHEFDGLSKNMYYADKYLNHEPTEGMKDHYTMTITTERTRPTRPTDRTTRRPIQSADTLLIQQWAEDNKIDEDIPQGEDSDEANEMENETTMPPTRKPLDLSKLEEAILNINRPAPSHHGMVQRPAFPPGASPNFQAAPPGGYYPPMYYPPPMPYPGYPAYNPYYPPYYQPQAAAPAAPYTPYYSRSGYRSAKITKGFNAGKVAETDSTIMQITSRQRKTLPASELNASNSTAAPISDDSVNATTNYYRAARREGRVVAFSRGGLSDKMMVKGEGSSDLSKSISSRSGRSIDTMTGQVKLTSGRGGRSLSGSTAAPSRNGKTLVPPRELDVKASIDAMTFHSGSKMRNITCVMQELGYLDERLEPNYEKMMERINRLQASTELKKDMVDGVKFCKQFSQCVPDVRKDKYQLSKEFLRPMFFFRCYKHKKLESCIMKDVRDRFASSQTTAFEDNSAMANDLRRSFHQRSDLASSVFEFMYGSAADDFDAIL